MDAYQSEFFRQLPAEVRRKAVRAGIAAARPESNFSDTFTYEGKTYRVISVSETDGNPLAAQDQGTTTKAE